MPPEPDLSLPKPPPARPAAREAAIEAALRRFDGVGDSPGAAAKSATTWNRHPVWGLAIAASLVAVIGLPAAFIALRDQGLSPTGVAIPATPPPQPQQQAVQTAIAPKPPIMPGPAEPKGQVPVRLQRNEVEPSQANAPVTEIQAAPPPEMGYAAAPPPPPPPPPPPAPAPMVAQKSAEGVIGTDLIVTGSRIPRPNVTSERDERDVLNSLPRSTARTAPDWVLNDRSYATFLTQLQNAVRANDREAVIKLVSLPLRVNFNRARFYRDTKSVRADYDRIFTPKVRRAIRAQRFEQLFGRDQGVMIGNGEVWFDHACLNSSCSRRGPVRIIAINPR